MVKDKLDDRCKKAIVAVTRDMKRIKQKLCEIENIEKDIDKKASYILETLSMENRKKGYSGLRNFYNDESGYEEDY